MPVYLSAVKAFQLPHRLLLVALIWEKGRSHVCGTASRPRYLSAYAKTALNSDEAIANKFTAKLIKRTRRQRARVQSTDQSQCVISPLCGHFQTRPFVNYFQIGMPIQMNPELLSNIHYHSQNTNPTAHHTRIKDAQHILMP